MNEEVKKENKTREPTFGILSVGSAILLFVLIFSANCEYQGCRGGSPYYLFMLLAAPVCIFPGLLFGVVGAIRKESPKWWYIIGLLLNVIHFGLCFNFIAAWFEPVRGVA